MRVRFLVVAAVALCAIPLGANAASMKIEPLSPQVGVGQLAAFTMYVDTQGADINAFEGLVGYDAKKLEFKRVADGDSIITTWLKKLSVSESGKLAFSGIIPGGYNGGKGKLVTVYFTVRATGEGV